MLEALDLIAGELADAAADPACWTKALDSINSFVDASGVVLLSVDERLRHAPMSTDVAEMIDDYFRSGWFAIDSREGCLPLLSSKGVVFDHEFQDVESMENTSYYADFLARHKRKWFAGLGANLDGQLWCLALQRSPGKGPFVMSDLPRLRAVQARLAAAARQSQAVSCSWFKGAFDAFDLAGAAAVSLDRDGRVVDMSGAARAILGRHVDRAGCLRFATGDSSSTLDEMLGARLRRRLDTPGLLGRFPVEIDRRAYLFEAHGVRNSPDHVFSKASVLLRFWPQPPDPAAVLRTRYQLTDAEARVALALAAGAGVSEIADSCGVKPNTVRVHLKAAYAKTGTGTQAKLVAMIGKLHPAVDG